MLNPPPLFEHDWLEIIDLDAWKAAVNRPRSGPPIIGRHSRPDPLKWPDDAETTLLAYPNDPAFDVRVLGGGDFLAGLLGAIPSNWDVVPFNGMSVPDFLASIDYFVYHHHSRWVEAFGRVMIEAMASGALAVLPPHFEVVFGEAAVYGPPESVRDIIRSHHDDPALFRARIATANDVLREQFSHEAHVIRLERIIGKPRPTTASGGATTAPADTTTTQPPSLSTAETRRVLFLTSNGVGMGHLTRMLAIANRCGPAITPVFVTMPQAMRVVEEQGYLAEFLPFHGYLGCDLVQWNHYLRHEIDEMINFYQASVIVFDGNVAYGGLVGALRDNPTCMGVWCRRAMWRPGGASADNIERESAFHAVVEPGELAGAYDAGLTVSHRGRTRMVDPIRLLDASDMLDRESARAEIGVQAEGLAVLVQLGSGNNYDYNEVRKLVLERLGRETDVQIVVAEWLIAEAPTELPDGVVRLSAFPNARYFNAFDFAVSAAGYNSFHELIAAGLPTIFVPNENPMMDQQIVRAQYAERQGLGLCVRVNDVYHMRPSLERMLDAAFRKDVRDSCLSLPTANGAAEVATFLGELVHTLRADHNPRALWTTD